MKLFYTLAVSSLLIQSCLSQNNSGGKDSPTQKAIVVDAGTQETTQFGAKINNTDSLQAGDRGATLLEDFMLREKIMHFDHERIPERVVHARGVAAHGYFQAYKDFSDITAAKFLRNPGEKTPVFVRFSTVLGSRGSADTVRDVRGFATRFYTEEGNWDLVGNAIAPFFIQDAMKFPDLIHAGKPEPDKEVPQAGTAHCTAYDFFSQHTESIHTVLWALSGRGLARSLRQVEGFGVHTFRFINEDSKVVFVKFIWKPMQGLSNLVWSEAQQIAGKDADYHRNDLYDAIENGDYPEWELGVQIVQPGDENQFDFDILDSTKIIPESLVPITKLGKMTLNRNVDNYFSETEQVTFHLGHVVRGITFTDDPLLQGRLFSYTDTQMNRMNSVNYMQLPINRPLVPVHNNQRDGYQQHNIYKGKVAYYPNKLQDNTPSVVSKKDGGYLEYAESLSGHKQRGKSGKFADHYSQAQLFYNSLTTAEQQQLVDGARFELGKCNSDVVKKNMLEVFNKVNYNLAVRIADSLGLKAPAAYGHYSNKTDPYLSIDNYPRPNNIKTKKVAILTAPGIDTGNAKIMHDYLTGQGAYVDYIGLNQGEQNSLNITQTYTTSASVLYDAVYVPSGSDKAFDTLNGNTSAFLYDEPAMFVLDAYRHGKPIAATGKGLDFLKNARVPSKALSNNSNTQKEYGVLVGEPGSIQGNFKKALINQRYWNRMAVDSNAQKSPTKANDTSS